jgi:TPR repeat protein
MRRTYPETLNRWTTQRCFGSRGDGLPARIEYDQDVDRINTVRLPWLSKLQYLVTGKSALRELMVRADDGDALAQHLLAGIYYSSKDVPKEMEQAIYWWRKSAEHLSRAMSLSCRFLVPPPVRITRRSPSLPK